MAEEVNPSDYARFVTSLAITGTASIPGVGPIISLGLTIADSAGAFDSLYEFFNNPNEGVKRHSNWDLREKGVMLPI